MSLQPDQISCYVTICIGAIMTAMLVRKPHDQISFTSWQALKTFSGPIMLGAGVIRLLLLPTPVIPTNATGEWTTFRSEGGRYSIRFPGPVTETENSNYAMSGHRVALTDTPRKIRYDAGYYVVPRGYSFDTAKYVEHLAREHGQPASRRGLRVNSVWGEEFVFHLRDGAHYIQWMFRNGDRVHFVHFTSPPELLRGRESDTFFRSLKFW